MDDIQLLYAMVDREVCNFLAKRGFGFLTPWSGTITEKLIDATNGVVNAFIDGMTNRLDADQLSEFTKEEVNSKIDDFKKRYQEKQNSLK